MSVITIFQRGIATARMVTKLSRGWAINAGDQSTLTLPDTGASVELTIGALIHCGHDRLPAWAGMADTDWKATLPASCPIYDIAYALSRRSPDAPREHSGTTAGIIAGLLAEFEGQEKFGFKLGESDPDASRTEELDQRSYWDLISDLVKNAGMELRIRPEINQGKLDLLVDVKRHLGVDTGYRLHDGEGGNMEISDAGLTGEIWTRCYAIGDQSTKQSRLTAMAENAEASRKYTLRSKTVQFSGLKEQSALEQAAAVWIAQNSGPRLTLTAAAVENELHPDTFNYMGLGNTVIAQATRLWLPDGRMGWRGRMRILAMAYDEDKNRVTMKLVSEEVL